MASRLAIGPDDTQFAVVSYGNEGTLELGLAECQDDECVKSAVASIHWKDQWTNTPDGLRVMREEVYGPGRGSREDARKVAVLITDGEANINAEQTIPEADRAREAGIELFVIGVGLTVNWEEAEGIAGDSANVLRLNGFEDLTSGNFDAVGVLLRDYVCSSGKTIFNNLYLNECTCNS